jgi:hypothetical protein
MDRDLVLSRLGGRGYEVGGVRRGDGWVTGTFCWWYRGTYVVWRWRGCEKLCRCAGGCVWLVHREESWMCGKCLAKRASTSA